MGNARLSDKELANLNAAAVTKEYRVKPHLGTSSVCVHIKEILSSLYRRLSNRISYKWVNGETCSTLITHSLLILST